MRHLYSRIDFNELRKAVPLNAREAVLYIYLYSTGYKQCLAVYTRLLRQGLVTDSRIIIHTFTYDAAIHTFTYDAAE